MPCLGIPPIMWFFFSFLIWTMPFIDDHSQSITSLMTICPRKFHQLPLSSTETSTVLWKNMRPVFFNDLPKNYSLRRNKKNWCHRLNVMYSKQSLQCTFLWQCLLSEHKQESLNSFFFFPEAFLQNSRNLALLANDNEDNHCKLAEWGI